MRRIVVATAILAFTAAPVMAQEDLYGVGRVPLYLFSQKSVQEELKMSKEQVESGIEALAKQLEAMHGLRDLAREERTKKFHKLNQEAEKAVKEILKPEQAIRLRQINLQLQGGEALVAPDVAKELKLTDDQNQMIKNIGREERIKMIIEVSKDKERSKHMQEEALKKIVFSKEPGNKMLELLTAERKAKWKEMTGKPFTGKIEFGPGRGQ